MPTVEPAGTALFLRRWLRRPFATGAVVPSGRLLAEAMARTTRSVIDGRPGHVVEFDNSDTFGLWPRWAQSCPHANSKPLVKEHRSNFPGLSFKEQQKELGKMVSVFYQCSLRFSGIHLNSFSVNHCKSRLQKEHVTLSPWKGVFHAFTYK